MTSKDDTGDMKPTSLPDQLRRILDTCGVTRYRICQETGIHEQTLSKFYLGQRGLPMKTLCMLWDYLGLEITRRSKPAKRKEG